MLFLLIWSLITIHCISQSYDTQRWDITISNPNNSSHDIPIHILMPVTNASAIKFPLLLFMHGDPCEWWWYQYISDWIVPNGYIAGLVASYEPAGPFTGMAIDLRYSLDYLYNQSMTNVSSPIYNKLTYKSIASGHSAGADASLLSMGQFKNQGFKYRFDAVYAMASANTIEVQQAIKYMESQTNKIPIFLIAGGSDCICPAQRSITIYDEISDDICKFYSIIVNGTHCHFADIPVIDHTCYDVEEADCSSNEKNRTIVPREIQLDLCKNYLLQYMNAALKDTPNTQMQQQHYDALYSNMMSYEQEGYMKNVTYNCKVV